MSTGPQTLEDISKKIAIKRWGFVPDREVKLIHFVNGFFRALSGRSGSPNLLHKAAAKFKAGKSRTTNEQFIEDARDHLDFIDQREDPEAVKDVRMALDLMLSQDKAVFPSGPYSFTATHWLHTSSDPSDQQTGRLMAGVLSAGPQGTEIVENLRDLLDQPDDLYRLTAPLLDDTEMGPPPHSADDDAFIQQLTQPGRPLRLIQQAAERLVKHAHGMEKTAALLRIATMGSFGVYLHMVNATQNALEEEYRVPLLLCKKPPSRSMREASRRTFGLARRRLQSAFREELTDELRRRGDDDLSVDEYKTLMRGWLIQADQDDEDRVEAEELMDQFKQSFEFEREGTEDTFRAFVHAATPTCLEAMGPNRPAACAIRLSTHGGLLGPFRGRGEKYYRPAPQFLDMLVAALLEPEEEIPATEFWERAWEAFGILSGARSRHDAKQLRKRGIRQVSTDTLTENAGALHDHLTRLGHAQTYADGMTLISVDQ
jgi:hypothetical protein